MEIVNLLTKAFNPCFSQDVANLGQGHQTCPPMTTQIDLQNDSISAVIQLLWKQRVFRSYQNIVKCLIRTSYDCQGVHLDHGVSIEVKLLKWIGDIQLCICRFSFRKLHQRILRDFILMVESYKFPDYLFCSLTSIWNC